MPFEFLSNLDTTTLFLLLVIFVLFILSMKKIFSIIMKAVWIAVISVLFPIVMNRFFGFDIPTDADSLISFLLLGLGIYFIYLIAKSVYRALGLAEKVVKKTIPHREKKEAKRWEKETDKGEKESRATARQEDKELEEREKELIEKERQIAWKASLEESKKAKPGRWEKKYAIIKEPVIKEKPEIKKPSSAVTPLPVIEHKIKKKKRKK